MPRMRIDKLIGSQTRESRNDLKKTIKRLGVEINGTLIKDPGKVVDSSKDVIIYRGQEIKYQEYVYLMLYKPEGYVSSVEDPRDPTVIELVMNRFPRKDYFPVGRLDKDTEGLLVISNDGQLAHRILSPKKHIPKTYYVETAGILTEDDYNHLARGILLEDGYQTLPARTEKIEDSETGSRFYLTITEGKYHQVKRMVGALGHRVDYLKRIAMGNLFLDEALKPGEVRPLTAEEVQLLEGVAQDGDNH